MTKNSKSVLISVGVILFVFLLVIFMSKKPDSIKKADNGEEYTEIEQKIDEANNTDQNSTVQAIKTAENKNIGNEQEKLSSIPTKLKLILSKKMIEVEKSDKVNFRIELFDQYGKNMPIDNKDAIEIYVNNNKINGDNFSTDKAGQYSVYAKYGNLYSTQMGFVAKKTHLFKDPVLEEEVRVILGKKTGVLTKEELLEIPVLVLENKGINSIEGIENFENLEELKLTNNNISNIDSLKKLKKLKRLWLDNNKIKDIKPLSSLGKLHYLELGGNEISNIKPLSTMFSIKKLYIYDNDINDVRPLVNLNGLIELGIWDNRLEQSAENIFNYLEKKSCKIYK